MNVQHYLHVKCHQECAEVSVTFTVVKDYSMWETEELKMKKGVIRLWIIKDSPNCQVGHHLSAPLRI